VHTTDFARADSLTRGARFLEALGRDHPGMEVGRLDDAVLRMRARKSPAEVALLRRAAEISAAGQRQAMRAMAPGCNEGQVQAVLEGVFRGMGGEQPGYGSIVGSGPNALRLHYDRNDRVMQAGDVVVIDAATALAHYSADVTRTLPVSGRFTPDQRAIYGIVLDAQAAFVRQIRPGGTVDAANDSGRAVIAAGLARLGLIESPDATFDAGGPCNGDACRQLRLFAWHGYGGHGIGLEVHDPAQYYTGTRQFLPGDVFTVEPGIYVDPAYLDGIPDTPRNRAMLAKIRPVAQRYANIGVRIEDDYRVAERGVEWLSAGVPRDVDAVEALMRQPSSDGRRCGLAPD
jgi:Xaa-Pro aminopeptidase